MRSDAGKLVHQDPDHLRAGWYLDLQTFLNTHCAIMIVNVRREVIHSARNIYKLAVGETLTHFFNRAMDISKVRLYLFYCFSIECNNKMKHPMGRGMLRTNINNKVSFSSCS